MKAIPMCASLLMALGSALSLGLMDVPIEIIHGADPSSLAEGTLHRYLIIIGLFAGGGLATSFWALRQARSSSPIARVSCLVAAISTVIPIWFNGRAWLKMKDLMVTAGVDPLGAKVVDTLVLTPVAASVWTGFGAIILLLGVSVSAQMESGKPGTGNKHAE